MQAINNLPWLPEPRFPLHLRHLPRVPPNAPFPAEPERPLLGTAADGTAPPGTPLRLLLSRLRLSHSRRSSRSSSPHRPDKGVSSGRPARRPPSGGHPTASPRPSQAPRAPQPNPFPGRGAAGTAGASWEGEAEPPPVAHGRRRRSSASRPVRPAPRPPPAATALVAPCARPQPPHSRRRRPPRVGAGRAADSPSVLRCRPQLQSGRRQRGRKSKMAAAGGP